MSWSLRVTGPKTTRRKTPRDISHRVRSQGTKLQRRLRRLQITNRPLTPRIQRRKHHHMMSLPRRRRTRPLRRVSPGRRSFSGRNRHGESQRAPARAHDMFLRDPATWSCLLVVVLPNLMAEEIPPPPAVRILRLGQVLHRRGRSQRLRSLSR